MLAMQVAVQVARGPGARGQRAVREGWPAADVRSCAEPLGVGSPPFLPFGCNRDSCCVASPPAVGLFLSKCNKQSVVRLLYICCTSAAGHYVALVKTPSGQWVCFDDEQVNAITESQVRGRREVGWVGRPGWV